MFESIELIKKTFSISLPLIKILIKVSSKSESSIDLNPYESVSPFNLIFFLNQFFL